MRILLDENLPRDLVTELTEHQVTTVQAVGWSGTKNGELLRRAHERFDVLVTMDRGLQYQQNLFRDGTAGEIDLGSALRGPVFEPLRDPVIFRQFTIHSGLARGLAADNWLLALPGSRTYH